MYKFIKGEKLSYQTYNFWRFNINFSDGKSRLNILFVMRLIVCKNMLLREKFVRCLLNKIYNYDKTIHPKNFSIKRERVKKGILLVHEWW